MKDKSAALGFWFIEVWIRLREGSKQLAIHSFKVQPKGRIQSVTGLMPKYPHALGISAAFNLEHLFPLELYQTWMSQIKRDCDSGNSIWREPFLRKPDMRLEPDAPSVQFAIKASDMGFEEGTFDFYWQI